MSGVTVPLGGVYCVVQGPDQSSEPVLLTFVHQTMADRVVELIGADAAWVVYEPIIESWDDELVQHVLGRHDAAGALLYPEEVEAAT